MGSDVRRTGIKRTVGRTLEDLRQFYLTTEDRERLAGMGRVMRAIYFASASEVYLGGTDGSDAVIVRGTR